MFNTTCNIVDTTVEPMVIDMPVVCRQDEQHPQKEPSFKEIGC